MNNNYLLASVGVTNNLAPTSSNQFPVIKCDHFE